MDFLHLVKKSRSYRRFDQSSSIDPDTIRTLVEYARLVPSGSNVQPLKYVGICSPEWNDTVFSTLAWAGYLTDWPGPAQGERPTAYIVICTDTGLRSEAPMDVGIAAQTILLAATERGLGGCMIGSVERDRLHSLLELPRELSISLVIALGKPAEEVILEECGSDESIKYYRDGQDRHHVPKRSLEKILVRIF